MCRNLRIKNLVHKGGIGAIFQQSAHQIGQKIRMVPNWRINAAGNPMLLQHLIMQSFPHAMQSLEFEICHLLSARTVQYGRDGMGVMGGKLRVDAIRHGQQFLRTTDVVHIGVWFCGQHRKTWEPLNLRQFDFRVPISALDQTHHDAAIQFLGQSIEPINDIGGALAIGLNDHPKPVPMGKTRL